MRGLVLALGAAATLGCQGLGRLDYTSLGRDMWQRPEDVIAALEIAPGDRVADLGSGDGYFVAHLARAVGDTGRVHAVDVDPDALEAVAERFPADATPVRTVLAHPDDPLLPDGSVDLVLLVNTYHHVDDRIAYFSRLQDDLAPGGRVAIIEPNAELGGLLSLALDEGHVSTAGDVEREMEAAGYAVVARPEFLPVQVFRVFGRRETLSVIPRAP